MGWIAPRIGLPAGVGIDPLDVDLSTVQFAADKVFRLLPQAEGLLHLEPQASWDGALADRMHVYSTLLHDRYKVPVYSVALLLRREANSPGFTGTLTRSHADGKQYLRFDYDVIRVWELPCEPLMVAGPGAAPLALLTDEAAPQLANLVSRMDRSMREAGAAERTRKLVLSSSFILLGLRYNKAEIRNAFMRVQGMKESTTYQSILAEGRVEGLEQGLEKGREEGRKIGLTEGLVIARRDTLLAVLRDRFPALPAELQSRVEAMSDASQLHKAILAALHVARIEDLSL